MAKDDIDHEFMLRVQEHMQEEGVKIAQLQEDIAEIKENTAELIEAWTNAKGALTVVRIIGAVIKWSSATLVAGFVLYHSYSDKWLK